MCWLWFFVIAILATFGLPLIAVGLILLLCEYSYGTPDGRTGGRTLFLAGVVLCSPLIAVMALSAAGVLR
jgi:hypothetical protein